MNILHRTAMVVPFFLLGGCVVPVSVTPNLCRAMQATDMLQVHLMFGTSFHGGNLIAASDWDDFVAKEITPRFPAGFTVLDSNGQWLDTVRHTVTREPSRIVWISTPDRRNLQHDLNAIRDAYKTRFDQQAVGLTIQNGCASF
ncbi:DUF3574 domain-containing protein [Gluconobacter wancherniae]|uniref:DUF3574 domain-containing protein n=1 Tax=Gluconobacter wancherniae TaxID=1307955 RepID=UPI001B8BEB70|nr:DUF3574 domain-containing protein [Gluconobacter wancherniae]MBS1063109.1 DUF3574 domain-containing protein [Gluconobacter wancherniae]